MKLVAAFVLYTHAVTQYMQCKKHEFFNLIIENLPSTWNAILAFQKSA